jgi:hypothetical protein
MTKAALQEKIDAAKKEITLAESDLELALGQIRSAPRAEKTNVSLVVESAFQRLRKARETLVELEGLLASADS